MILRYNVLLVFTLSLFSCVTALGQMRPVGRWRSHLPTNAAAGIATDGEVNYVITQKGYLTYKISDGYIEQYSKVEGLHDTNPIAVAYDERSKTTIIGYVNSNIDLIKDYNVKGLPYLKDKSFPGSKSIRDIYIENGLAYLSTGLGILVIDLAKQEVKETYVFTRGGQTMAINSFISDEQYYYAAADKGLYRILKTAANPQVFTNWQVVDTARAYSRLAIAANALFAATSGFTDTLYRIQGVGARQRIWFQDSTNLTVLKGIDSTLYIGGFNRRGSGHFYHLSERTNTIIDSTLIAYPKGVVKDNAGVLWLADLYQGLAKRLEDRHLSLVFPGGPNDPESYDLYARGGEVWVAHGSVTPAYGPQKKLNGLSHFKAEKWEWLTPYTYPLFRDSVLDFLVLEKDERTGTMYAGTHSSGIFELKADGSARMIKQGALLSNNLGEYPATGLAFDYDGHLWVNQNGLQQELAERITDAEWAHYSVPPYTRGLSPHAATKLIIDDYNQKWYVAPFGGGVLVNFEGQSRNLTVGRGSGNLPSPTVFSLVKDRDGAIWVGTDKGIGIFSNPSQVLADPNSEAELRVVQFDQFAGHLFSNESILSMAVDGANQKWIGTGNGVWLLSPDANKIIHRFTVDNSPLPSNAVSSIAVDQVTGDVYFGTTDGLISYRAAATEGREVASNDIKTFPSPILTGYSGPITLNGFTTDADVRITDIAGQLIYRAKATGGQLVWNGLDYTGHRPQTGVLLIFASNKDGSQTAVGKMMLMH
jgi:streptogramin lyase